VLHTGMEYFTGMTIPELSATVEEVAKQLGKK
jgi:hypothetical protein